jgi:hypothetical protein
MLVPSSSRHPSDALYPARMQLARCRRSGQPADILMVELTSIAGGRQTRRCATAVSSVLRVTDGVSMVPSLGGNGMCAVLESDGRARSAIDQRLRSACGNEIRLAWRRQGREGLRPLPVQRLLPRGLGSEREPIGSGR